MHGLPPVLAALLLTPCAPSLAQEPLFTQDFEAPVAREGLPESWTHFTDLETIEVSTEQAHSGEQSLKLVDDSEELAVGLRSGRVPVTPGEYCWVRYAYLGEPGNHQAVYVEFWTAEGGRPETKFRNWQTRGTGEWELGLRRVKVPEGAATVTIHLNSYSTNVATGYWDDIEFGVGYVGIYDRSPKPPADVMHPCGFYKAGDVERAKLNLEQHEWAQKVLAGLKSRAKFWMECPEEKLDYWIPDLTPFRVVDCPACGTGWRFAWKHLGGDAIQCGKCEFRWPNDDYPEDRSQTLLDPVGDEHTVPYYEGTPSTEHGSAASPVYRLSGRVRYSRVNNLSSLGALGKVYALTGEREYAERVRPVLLRLAEVYPHYLAHDWNRIYDDYSNLQSGKLSGWKLHDANVFVELAAAYDLTYNSGVYSDEDKVAIEEGVFREFTRLMTATSPRGCCINDGPFAMAAGALAGLMLADHASIAWAVDPPGGLLGFIEDYFLRDGHWYEASPSYEGMTLGQLHVTPEALRGYSDPESYTAPDRYDDLDLLQHPLMKKMLAAGASERMPDGLLPATNDSTFGARYPSRRAEVHTTWYPTEENLALMAWAFGGKVAESGDEYALFRRDPDISFEGVEPAAPSSESVLRPDVGWAILRTGDGATDAALMLDYGRHGSGHGHPDRLNIVYYDHGREVVTDQGYLGWGHPIHPWMRSTAAHNLVVVDGEPQATAAGELEAFGGGGPVQGVIASAPGVYEGVCEVYRRTVLTVDHGPGKRYAVDAFHVRGGMDHQYLFHADGEAFISPALQFAAADAADFGEAATGYTWLKELQEADAGEPLVCEWTTGDDRGRGVRLHVLSGPGTRLAYGRAPGLRDRKSPFNEVDLWKAIIRRPGPENLFMTVVEAYEGEAARIEVTELEVEVTDGMARAVEVTSGELTDIVIVADADAAGAGVELTDYDNVTFRGRLGYVSLRDGKPERLWMLAGEELACGDMVVRGVGEVTGTVTAVDQAGFTVTTEAELPDSVEWEGVPLVIAGKADGAYPIQSVKREGGVTVVELEGEPIMDIEVGEAFTVRPVTGTATSKAGGRL